MDEQVLLKCIEVTYSYLYALTYGNEKYYYKWSESSILSFNNFAALVDKRYKLATLGKNFVTNYFLFHYARLLETDIQRYSSKDKSGKIIAYGRFQIQDFISKQSFEKWINRDKKFDFCLKTNYTIAKYIVNITWLIDALGAIIHPESRSFELFEENIRHRYFGTSTCLIRCISETTMYHPDSIFCPKCKSKKQCKEILKVKHPTIYSDRIHE